jgi:hypothetical protein
MIVDLEVESVECHLIVVGDDLFKDCISVSNNISCTNLVHHAAFSSKALPIPLTFNTPGLQIGFVPRNLIVVCSTYLFQVVVDQLFYAGLDDWSLLLKMMARRSHCLQTDRPSEGDGDGGYEKGSRGEWRFAESDVMARPRSGITS